MKKIFPIITIYSVGHFYVDFICAFILSLIIFQNPTNLTTIASLVVLYNIIAFGTQPFFGFIVDKYKNMKTASIIGLIITTTGLLFFFEPIVAAIILGIGNAIYHIGGGVVALNLKPSKAMYPGIYVAPGALGLLFGGLLGSMQIPTQGFIIIGIGLTIILSLAIKSTPVPKIKTFASKKVNLIGIVLMLLLVSVCMRALIGYSLNLEWKSVAFLGLILTIAIASGKFFGGILADKFGFMKVGMIGLIIAAPLLTFFQPLPVLVFIGAFCFNLVMPITLTAIAEAIPNNKGFAFGLTTLSLIIGYALFFLLKDYLMIGTIFTSIVILINIGSLYLGLRKYEEMKV